MSETKKPRFNNKDNNIFQELSALPGSDISPESADTIKKNAILILNRRNRRQIHLIFRLPWRAIEVAFIMGVTVALGWDIFNLIKLILKP